MKILHLRSSEFFGGPERAIIGQCRSLGKFKLICASIVRRDQTSEFLRKCGNFGIETIAIPESFPGDLRVIGCMRRIIRERELDLVVSHDYKSNFFTYFAVRNTPARQIAHFRGSTAEDVKDKFYNTINWMFLRRISKILTVSAGSKRVLVSRGIPAEKVSVVPNAIECDGALEDEAPDDRSSRGFLKIVAAGRLSYEKGFDNLLRAVALLNGKTPAFKLSIYGHGPEEEKLKKWVDEYDISGCVEFCGFVEDIKPVFRNSDFLVLPSRSEGMPNVILEAWSQKLGVLSTAVGGVPEMIDDGVSGLLSPPDDIPAFSDKLLHALNNPSEMATYGKKGFEIVKERYSYGKQAELLEKIYVEYA
jgi:glycosyltransferase involved in cell wall biosynthesis